MKRTRWVAILVAMIMLAGALPFGIAEDEVASAPVDTFVAEAIDAQMRRQSGSRTCCLRRRRSAKV